MATYYWVGGAGTWDNANTTNWATSSGGAGGNGPPNNADTVIFDGNSGTGTVTLAATGTCNACTHNTANITVQLNANNTAFGVASAYTLSAGTLDLNNFSLTMANIASVANAARTMAFGTTGKVIITGNNATIVNLYNATTKLTLTGTPVFDCTYSGATGTRTFNAPAITADISINITAGTDTVNLGSGWGYVNLDFTGFAGTLTNITLNNVSGDVKFSTGMTVGTGTGTWNFTGTTATQKITTNGKTLDFPITINKSSGSFQLQDALTMGSTRTLTLTSGNIDLTGNSGNWTLSTGLFSSSNSNVRSIAFGTGNITITGNNAIIYNIDNATNLTYTGTPTLNCTYSGATGTRTIRNGSTSGGSQALALNLNVTAGTDTFTVGTDSYINNINMTGWVGAFGNGFYCYGNFTMSAGSTTYSGSATMRFSTTSSQNITMNGVVWDRPVTFNGVGGTFNMQDAFSTTVTRAVTLTNGTLNLKNGTTNTVGTFVTSGTNQKVLQSSLAGSLATLSQASGTVNMSYLTFKDISATGGATWNALLNCLNNQNNRGIYFSYQQGVPLPALPL